MTKLQCSVPKRIDEVVRTVQIATQRRANALRYLIYIARFSPNFAIREYGESGNDNCTLELTSDEYRDHFGDYRQKNIYQTKTQKDFFANALARGASMVEAGYWLSDPMNPIGSELHTDKVWRAIATRVFAIKDYGVAAIADPSTIPDYKALVKSHENSNDIAARSVAVLDKFMDHLDNENTRKRKQALEADIAKFEAEKDHQNRIALVDTVLAHIA